MPKPGGRAVPLCCSDHEVAEAISVQAELLLSVRTKKRGVGYNRFVRVNARSLASEVQPAAMIESKKGIERVRLAFSAAGGPLRRERDACLFHAMNVS